MTGRTGGAGPLSAHTTVVGVIGMPVAHSLSPRLHNAAFAALGLDWVSVGFPVPEGEAATALEGARALGVRGLSVTMPHKEAAADAVEEASETVRRLHAANCVDLAGGSLVGVNTDGAGFVAALREHEWFEPAGERCVVLGAGGAARAVVLALAEAGAAEVVVVNRRADRGEVAARLAGACGRVGSPADVAGAALVVKATPEGMTGVGSAGDGEVVVPGRHQVAVDLVYDPPATPWLAAAEAAGARCRNGLGTLLHQAAFQLERWTGMEVPRSALWAAVEDGGPDAPSGGEEGARPRAARGPR